MASSLTADQIESLERYVAQINRYKVLSREREQELARQYRDTGDQRVAHALVNANLKFVVKVANEYRGYALDILDLIQEGNAGLTAAVRKFDPDKGYRLISYAVWWIRAYIQNYVMSSWSLVKIGTTQAQRKLFFKLRSEKAGAGLFSPSEQEPTVQEIATRLGVPEGEVSSMELRLGARDFSLDSRLSDDGAVTHLERLVDSRGSSQEDTVAKMEQDALTRTVLDQAMSRLSDRERYIVHHRLMADEPETLQQVGRRFRVSRERARQIQANVVRKLKEEFCGFGMEAVAA